MKIILIISILSVMAKVTLAGLFPDTTKEDYKKIADINIRKQGDDYLGQLQNISEKLSIYYTQWIKDFNARTKNLNADELIRTNTFVNSVKNKIDKLKYPNAFDNTDNKYGNLFAKLNDKTFKLLEPHINNEIQFGEDAINFQLSSKAFLIAQLEKHILDKAIETNKKCKSSVCNIGDFNDDVTYMKNLVEGETDIGKKEAINVKLNLLLLTDRYVVGELAQPMIDSVIDSMSDFLKTA